MRKLTLALLLSLSGTGLYAQNAAISKWAAAEILNTSPLKDAHTGISIYEPAAGKYWYQYQDEKYFTPASNTKIFSLYTGLKILGDSLPAARYFENDTAIFVKGTADPSFLHPDYPYQPLLELLQKTKKQIYLVNTGIANKRYGPGWAWSDYADDYQPELNAWPMYGNVVRIYHHKDTSMMIPDLFDMQVFADDSSGELSTDREERSNLFTLRFNRKDNSTSTTEVPYITGSVQDLRERLEDTLHRTIGIAMNAPKGSYKLLRSIPTDSLFKPMMHRSDNFFAEQTLMMSSALMWDSINSKRVIRYMQDNALSTLPNNPQWVDGSGLSRYNLFTPRDFVQVLTQMYKEYPQERLWEIFPTGGKGTLKAYYKEQFVHAKTGTLSGAVALSGYLVTKKNKTLVFSVLVNNNRESATSVRRAVERLLTMIYNQY
ncbi:D-alanyl-D-alanine carboxypeptidase/D-alanyl-D-alanine-endopeptidase [Chitinophaga sp. Cy-1792]|uniref:D-alanyl-D-alanine carboxypeptidase/D-alanyl-D-alanine-endopeptidase n=1 Tax=Chitinophaga sp. Cy-1792 TaxID=2608339 RepID=UPI001422681E|nr:D-alanyl-D-alanine carboxypeptidase [Chitinophaga sp. Cy-1792]NIG52355.1 D-alanyl-D-alanine carboxypeptidase/D-alanyl-D-alanine-endopeptidase [Chitinophaga sp. Cy-1792]